MDYWKLEPEFKKKGYKENNEFRQKGTQINRKDDKCQNAYSVINYTVKDGYMKHALVRVNPMVRWSCTY